MSALEVRGALEGRGLRVECCGGPERRRTTGAAGPRSANDGGPSVPGQVIAFTNSKGGVGKSTLAVHLAIWLQERGHRVAFIDADVQRSSSRWLSQMDQDLLVTCLHTPDDIIEQTPRLQEAADYVVADGPGGLTELTRAILLIAQVALIPVGPSALDLLAAEQAVRVVKQAQQIRGGMPRGMLILNRVQARTRLAREAQEAVDMFGLPVASKPIRLRTAFADASGQASVVWQMGTSAKDASKDLNHVFGEVMGDGQEKSGGDPERRGSRVPARRAAAASETE
jgi:chromosome partitioning protein